MAHFQISKKPRPLHRRKRRSVSQSGRGSGGPWKTLKIVMGDDCMTATLKHYPQMLWTKFDSGARVVIERRNFLTSWKIPAALPLSNGDKFYIMPATQDHKHCLHW